MNYMMTILFIVFKEVFQEIYSNKFRIKASTGLLCVLEQGVGLFSIKASF